MLSNKDINFNDETQVLTINGEKHPVVGDPTTAITEAINALDVEAVGGTGSYISAISEADGKIIATSRGFDNTPTAGSPDPVSSSAIKTYVDNAINAVAMHISGETSITIPLSDTYTVCIFGTISVTPISSILTVVTGGTVDVTDLTNNSLASRADITVNLNDKTLTIASKNTDAFYVNILA